MRNREWTRETRTETRATGDLLCFSHLRWGFVYQRPSHLMARFARDRRVFYVEEPVVAASRDAHMRVERAENGLHVCVPHVPPHLDALETIAVQRTLLQALLDDHLVEPEVLWFYTPTALELAGHLDAPRIVYDCIDELPSLASAPSRLPELEKRLFERAHVVFTGGHGLYEAKRRHHRNVHAFPSSVDAKHFARAREVHVEPDDQFAIPRPRAGYSGVIDERLDLRLVARLADQRPELQLVFLGPVVKIDPASLPQRPNLHWLGTKKYAELPSYLAGWDVALMPFVLEAATRFISPTKTLEYLAAGLPVVSTALRDVVSPYGERKLVHIGDARSFPSAVDAARACDRDAHRAAADAVVASTSWDATWSAMSQLVSAGRPGDRRRASARADQAR